MTAAAIGLSDDAAAAATADFPSVVDLLRDLVRTPSRGGVDDYQPIVDAVASWLSNAGLAPRVLDGPTGPLAIACDVTGAGAGPRYVLDACLDTAAFGDEAAWSASPTSAEIADGWLYGRGSCDSKVAVAIFCHLMTRLAATPESFHGTVTALFDLDEHTGGFGGIRRYLDEQSGQDVAGVLIGYPGPDTIVVGGRGFLRVKITVFGQADHSASRRAKPINAVVRAAQLVDRLRVDGLGRTDDRFGMPPKLTVTSIRGGAPGGYSVVPDRCELEVDIRLTPSFDADAARTLLRRTLAELDGELPAPRRSVVELTTEPWPPFQLAADHRLPAALRAGAVGSGFDPILVVAGPSNIGNLLATHDIPATAGFGVRYRALHGTDEAIELATVAPVQAAYHRALLTLLPPSPTGHSRAAQ